MSPLIKVDDYVEVVRRDTYFQGDIVAVYINNNIYIHRILSLNKGKITTKGDKTFTVDSTVDSKMVIGVVAKNLSSQKILKNNIGSRLIAVLSRVESDAFEKMKKDSNHSRLRFIYCIRKCMDLMYRMCTKNY